MHMFVAVRSLLAWLTPVPQPKPMGSGTDMAVLAHRTHHSVQAHIIYLHDVDFETCSMVY